MYTYAMLSFGFGLLAMTIVFGLVGLFSLLGSSMSKHMRDNSK